MERRRYRFRFLDGCQARFLILDFSRIPGVEVWQIGNEGGFLAAPVNLTATNGNRLLMGLAERADVIVDFTNVPVGNHVLGNLGPDEPFGGGEPGDAFEPADPATTGQIMQFRVGPPLAPDRTTPPQFLALPRPTSLPKPVRTRKLALLEMMSMTDPSPVGEPRGPAAAMLGIVSEDGVAVHQEWMDAVTENPSVGDTEVWEFYNFTVDAHPMHVHEVAFEVVDRQALVLDAGTGEPVQPVAVPRRPAAAGGVGERLQGHRDRLSRGGDPDPRPVQGQSGQFVWHCHIVEHEDNEMMRPYRIGPVQPGQPGA